MNECGHPSFTYHPSCAGCMARLDAAISKCFSREAKPVAGNRIIELGDHTIVHLSDADAQLAQEWSAAIMETGLLNRPNYAHTSGRDDRYIVGYLGELAFAQWMTANEKRFLHRVNLTGKSAPAEFLVWRGGRRFTLDVKTAGEPTHKKMLSAEVMRQDAHYYFGARIENIGRGIVSLWGWTLAEQFHANAVANVRYRTAYSVELTQLQELKALLQLLENGPQERSVIRT